MVLAFIEYVVYDIRKIENAYSSCSSRRRSMEEKLYDYNKVLREKIKHEREKKSWTVAWFAKLVAMDVETIKKIESGKCLPTPEEMYTIAKIFSLEPYMLFMPAAQSKHDELFYELFSRLVFIRKYSYVYNTVATLIMDLSTYKMRGRGRP